MASLIFFEKSFYFIYQPFIFKKETPEYVCAKVPESRTPLEEEKEIELYPCGCAKLRMTELPLV